MNKVKIFGLFEHVGFYAIVIFLFLYAIFKDDLFVYAAIISWIVSMSSHVMEDRARGGKTMKKTIVGI